MSRDIIRRVVIFCVVVVVVAGLRLLPEWWARRAGREVAGEAAKSAVQDAIRQSIDEVARDAARKVADDVRREVTKDNPGGTTRGAATAASAVIDAVGYRIMLPDHSTVDPVDNDHLATANLPGGGTLMIVAIDKKEQAAASFDQAVASLRGKLENPAVRTTDTFDPARAVRSTAFDGGIQGKPFGFEIGQIEGRSRACVIILEYPEARRGEVMEMARKALGTLQIKD